MQGRGGGRVPQGAVLAEECLRAETKTKESEETKKWEGKEKRFVFRAALLPTSLHSLKERESESGRARQPREKGKRNSEKRQRKKEFITAIEVMAKRGQAYTKYRYPTL